MIDPNEFAETADYLLRMVEMVYAEHDVDLPSRRYLAVGGQGTTVHEAEQVTVSFEQAYTGRPGAQAQEPARCDSIRTGVFVVEIVRCVPQPNTAAANPATPVPSRYGQEVTGVQALPADVQTAHAKKQMVDAMLLLEAGLRTSEGTLVGAVADVSAGPESGGMQAMVMMVTSSATSAFTG